VRALKPDIHVCLMKSITYNWKASKQLEEFINRTTQKEAKWYYPTAETTKKYKVEYRISMHPRSWAKQSANRNSPSLREYTPHTNKKRETKTLIQTIIRRNFLPDSNQKPEQISTRKIKPENPFEDATIVRESSED
jgi:hypothetical protein